MCDLSSQGGVRGGLSQQLRRCLERGCHIAELSLLRALLRVPALAVAPLAGSSCAKPGTALGDYSGRSAHGLCAGEVGRGCGGEQPLSCPPALLFASAVEQDRSLTATT